MLLAEAEQHAAEVLADEFGQERFTGIVGVEVVLLEDVVGEIGASGEGEFLGENKGVVAIEEEGSDLTYS